MSFRFPEPRDRLTLVVVKFLEEATDALDEAVPLSRRAALAYKWCILGRVFGEAPEPPCSPDMDDGEIVRVISRLLDRVSTILASSR